MIMLRLCFEIVYSVHLIFYFLLLNQQMHTQHTWLLQNVSGVTLFLRNTKEYNHLSYISFKIVPLWKPFQFFRRILNYVSSITKALSPQCFSQLEPGQESVGDAPVLSHCSSLWNPWPKPTGVLEHCREGETNSGSPSFDAFPTDRIPKATKVSKYISLLTVLPWGMNPQL